MALRILEEEAKVQREAEKSTAESGIITDSQYRAGTVSYLNIVSARATSLTANRNSLDITGRRLLASVALLKALGGGWGRALPTGS